METAVIVKVAVSAAPYSIDKPYDYLVPDALLETALPGVRVIVPFGRGNRESDAIILSRSEGVKTQGLKSLKTVLDQEPVLDSDGLALALWMRQRYFCTLFEAVKTILPTGLWYQLKEIWHVADGLTLQEAIERSAAIKKSGAVLDILFSSEGQSDLETLKSLCGDDISFTLRSMQKEGVLVCENSTTRRASDKTRRMVSLALCPEDAMAIMEPKRRSAPQRYEVVKMLSSVGKISAAELSYFTGASPQMLRGLEKSGIISFSQEEELRVPVILPEESATPIILNEEQQSAFDQILSLTKTGKSEAVLLHGVTGSGKTQVYIRLVEEILAQGKTAIILVPEIVLTPQMMRKFSSHFGNRVAMLHSSLRVTERYDQWKRIRRGDVQVVLGTRSAIFAPLKNIGLIVMDEEQEGSYQSENPPRYHTRDIAKFLCARNRCVLVLGSATPSIETAWNAEQGKYQKALLRKRYNSAGLPQVIISDLKEEIKRGNPGLIGSELRQELEQNLQRGEQSILFLNRRGNSRMLLCGECGQIPECPRCSVAMTYHSANERLMCHYCGHSEKVSESCRSCGGRMKHIGAGTQKVEQELQELFPGTKILRMDADTTSGGHEKILRQFEEEKIPILIGTQMVAKGLDFENVTLVGVLSADLSLYVDNYRAAERTFNLLTQVVGRAGRGGKSGRAVIQTYTPGNDVIRSAAKQDFCRFYEGEIKMRWSRRYPPFSDLFTITISGGEEGVVLRAAVGVRETLRRLFSEDRETEVLGPAPAPILKMNNRYRYRIILVGKNEKQVRERLSWLLKEFANDRANRGLNIFIDCNTPE